MFIVSIVPVGKTFAWPFSCAVVLPVRVSSIYSIVVWVHESTVMYTWHIMDNNQCVRVK